MRAARLPRDPRLLSGSALITLGTSWFVKRDWALKHIQFYPLRQDFHVIPIRCAGCLAGRTRMLARVTKKSPFHDFGRGLYLECFT